MKTNYKKLAIVPFLALSFIAASNLFIADDASAIVPTAWGPQDRATFTYEVPATYPTFNSITNNPTLGDERNFVRVREYGDPNPDGDEVTLEVGKEYEIAIYYHNNAASNYNASGKGIAENVRMRTEFPSYLEAGQSAQVVGFITSSNANPGEVWDSAYLNAHEPVYLNYVVNSAVLHNLGTSNGTPMSGDALLGDQGVLLSYWNDLWGIVPGCNEYGGYLTYRIKVDQPNFSVDKMVKKADSDSDYQNELVVAPGDKLEYRIHFKNTGTTEQTGVTFHDLMPDGLSYITGTTFSWSTRHPEGGVSPDSLFGDGLGVGAMIAGEESWARYQVQVSDSEEIFPCGETEVYNAAYVATHDGKNSAKTKVIVKRDCGDNPTPTPTPNPTPSSLPKTGPGEIAMLIAVLLVIGGGGYYFYRSRKMLKTVASTAGAGDQKPAAESNIVLDGIKNNNAKDAPEAAEPVAESTPVEPAAPAEEVKAEKPKAEEEPKAEETPKEN